MVSQAAALDAYEQIQFARHMMRLPFGRKPPFRKPSLPTSDRTVLERIFEQGRSVDAMAHMPWQYLCQQQPDDQENLGVENEFNVSFALWFLIDSCCRTWSIDMTSALKACFSHCWTTTWGPVAIINMVYAETCDSYLIELSRQAPLPERASVQGAAERNLFLKKMQQLVRNQATVACIIIFHKLLGEDLLRLVRSYAPYASIPRMPMAISFLFCELRKNGDTGLQDQLLRYRRFGTTKRA